MSTCVAIKRDGEPCRARAQEGYEYCYNHRPDTADARREVASRGGRAGGNGRTSAIAGATELADVRREVREVAGGVLDGSISTARAAVAIQALNALARVMELERRADLEMTKTYTEAQRKSFVSRVAEAVRGHIHDPDTRKQIFNDLFQVNIEAE